MTAREYFFKILAPDHKRQSYAAVYHNHLPDLVRPGRDPEECRAAVAKAVNHIPTRSNDFLIERSIEDLISRVPADFRARLENMFVAKVQDFEANAAALGSGGDYEGDLILFNAGLSDVCGQYAIVYYESVSLFINRLRPEVLGHGVELDQLEEHLLLLKTAQERWDKLGVIHLHREDLIYSTFEIDSVAAYLTTHAIRFILCHEIAHHILGHTGNHMNLLSHLDKLPERCKYWKTTTLESHRMEFEADACALAMTLEHRQLDLETAQQQEREIGVGALLTFTVLGQLVHNVDQVTSSHPSISSRFDQCVEILRATCKEDIELYLLLIKRFQEMLWVAQGKGLGRRWSEEELVRLG